MRKKLVNRLTLEATGVVRLRVRAYFANDTGVVRLRVRAYFANDRGVVRLRVRVYIRARNVYFIMLCTVFII